MSTPAPNPRDRVEEPTLRRRLGPLDGAAIVVSNVIGGGIFFVPIIVAQMLPAPSAMLWMWFAGGALAFAGAMAYAELAALRPKAGGEYVYLDAAYGRAAAFLTPEQQRLLMQLDTKQIVALRFASDAEMPALLERAAREKLPPKEIKRAIKTWVPDYDRT